MSETPAKHRILVFASGTVKSGGSGFEKLFEATQNRGLLYEAEIVAVVSNHEAGGVFEKAQRLGVQFEYFPGPWLSDLYRGFVGLYQPDLVALSGWLKPVYGLDPRTTINIHPGWLQPGDPHHNGGPGGYGHFVHEEAIRRYREDPETFSHTAVSMHYVTEDEYDAGPVFFRLPIAIEPDNTAETLATRVNAAEHKYQSLVTHWLLKGIFKWDGDPTHPVVVPFWYQLQDYCPEELRVDIE